MRKSIHLFTASIKFAFIMIFMNLSTAGVSQTIVRYPQGSHAADIINPNISASVITPNSGINEVPCGSYISAEDFDQSSWPNALSNGDYWQFTLTPNSGYEIDLTNLTVLRTGSDRDGAEPLEKRAYLYRIETGTWNFLASYNSTNLSPNICTNQSSGTNLDFNVSTSSPVTFAFLYYGNNTTDPAQARFGEVTLTGDAVLPVEFVDFKDIVNEGKIDLKWTTASEINNDGFEIQKSSDGQNWETIDFVKGQGSSTSINTYEYQDVDPHFGFNGLN